MHIPHLALVQYTGTGRNEFVLTLCVIPSPETGGSLLAQT